MSFIYSMTDIWNAAGTTFTAIKMNVTDIASQAGSLLIDLQVASASKFSVTKAGVATFAGALTAAGLIGTKAGNGGVIANDTGSSRYQFQAQINGASAGFFGADATTVIAANSGGTPLMVLTQSNGNAAFVGSLTHGGNNVIITTTSLSNGAGASAGTITNAPSVGNPTKWVPISDNGVTRYIPAW